jgi:hypothetical protein
MSDINTPDPRYHSRAPAEGTDDATEPPNDTDDAEPDEDMSSYNVQPPPVDADIPGVPDASSALGEIDPDEPGANATGVGV